MPSAPAYAWRNLTSAWLAARTCTRVCMSARGGRSVSLLVIIHLSNRSAITIWPLAGPRRRRAGFTPISSSDTDTHSSLSLFRLYTIYIYVQLSVHAPVYIVYSADIAAARRLVRADIAARARGGPAAFHNSVSYGEATLARSADRISIDIFFPLVSFDAR